MITTCLACGHAAELADGPAVADSILRCDECGARMAYGELAPRVVIEPAERNGHPMMRLRFQDPATKADVMVYDIDPQHAFMIAQTIIGMVRP